MLACHHMNAQFTVSITLDSTRTSWGKSRYKSRYRQYVGKERLQRQCTGTTLQNLRKFAHSDPINYKETVTVVRLDPDIQELVIAVPCSPICRKVLCALMAKRDPCSCKKALRRGPRRPTYRLMRLKKALIMPCLAGHS